jgi:tellurite resistance protein TehA-like permease
LLAITLCYEEWTMNNINGFQQLRSARGGLERIGGFVFAICCVVVIAISVHDALLVVLYRSTINQFEENPVGKWLLEIQGGSVGLFVSLKLIGTAVVLTVLITLYQIRPRLGILAALGLAVCQVLLFWYLTRA